MRKQPYVCYFSVIWVRPKSNHVYIKLLINISTYCARKKSKQAVNKTKHFIINYYMFYQLRPEHSILNRAKMCAFLLHILILEEKTHLIVLTCLVILHTYCLLPVLHKHNVSELLTDVNWTYLNVHEIACRPIFPGKYQVV